ncbi:MAG: SDR family NAD(P)-dependent oxidoreductase [Rhizobiaceae bacterium]|nr:SDR family NAD(P)-dependent oxidoreductase [Rhizobiaceae bacterium]
MAEKIWFVTGASRGFGRLWTEAALKRGDKVAATARKLEALKDLHEAYPDSVLPLALDVTDRAAVFAAIDQAHKQFGRIDVILNNAGYGLLGTVEEVKEEDARAQIDTNLFGALWVMQAAAPIMRAQGSGHIIGVSSIGGLMAWPAAGLYQASKTALEAVTEAFAGEVSDFGIKVTLLEPGAYATEWGPVAVGAATMPEYDGARLKRNAMLKDMQAKDPKKTTDVVLQLVDMENPPLRLMLGSVVLPMVRGVYQKRLAEWDAFYPLASTAE